jgi:hypothetical protein
LILMLLSGVTFSMRPPVPSPHPNLFIFFIQL